VRASFVIANEDQPPIQLRDGRVFPDRADHPWAFNGDWAAFQLICEAKRIGLVSMFDPMMAVHALNVEPLPPATQLQQPGGSTGDERGDVPAGARAAGDSLGEGRDGLG
jgi:hypothetical protein